MDRRFGLVSAIAVGCLLSACSRRPSETPSGGAGAPGASAAPQESASGVETKDLEREIAAIGRSRTRAANAGEGVEPSGSAAALVKGDRTPPRGATNIPRATEATLTLVRSPAVRAKRTEGKAAPEGGRLSAAPAWNAVAFAHAQRQPARGLDPALASVAEGVRARGYTYAFLVLNEQLSEPVERELQAAGVRILGPHGAALKVRVPADPARLRAISALGVVESIGYAQPGQKIEPRVQAAARQIAGKLPGVPVVISAFDEQALKEVQEWLGRNGATVGRVHARIQSISAVVAPAALESLAALDTVLYVELSVPGGGGHDNSMAVMGVDYLRPGGPGLRFTGAGITLGILDTGFMVASAAPTPHQDLNKFGCGRNFTSDAAGPWNDQNGHGTHVLGTATGTGTADARFRGVATGVGSTGPARIRAAKIWDSTSSGSESEELDGQDYMDDASDCGAGRPQVVSQSGGARGSKQVGTDARSRGLDQIVWDTRQTWVVCSGNTGPGAGTIWSPGVAKNALTVGNVLDSGDGTIGDAAGNASLGPTGDGRMKPNVVATGSSIRSARASTTNGYTDMSGCSMATPHVSGIAATLMEHYPEFRTLPHLMRAHLMSTALFHDNVAAPVNNTPAPDTMRNTFGLGRVSPYVGHWAHFNPAGWSTHWAWQTITRDRWGFHDIEVPRGTRRLVVAMTWDEPPASAGASSAVTYDLDLWLDREPFCTPDGKGQCGEWASQSWIDNTEYQIVENPPPGRYRLKIVNWNAPASGVPAAVSATIIRGATTPDMQLSVSAQPQAVPAGGRVSITTSVFNPSWVLSGVHLQLVGLPAGATLEQLTTVREDNVTMDFTSAAALSLGTIVQGDTRRATWRFRFDTPGPKTFTFRARSENGGVREQSVTVGDGT